MSDKVQYPYIDIEVPVRWWTSPREMLPEEDAAIRGLIADFYEGKEEVAHDYQFGNRKANLAYNHYLGSIGERLVVRIYANGDKEIRGFPKK